GALTQSNTSKPDRNNNYFGSEFSFELDSLNLITAELFANKGVQDFLDTQSSISTDELNTVLQRYNLKNNGRNQWGSSGFSLNYQLGFRGKSDRLLTFSYKNSHADDIQYRNLDLSDRINYNLPNYKQGTDGEFKEQTAQMDYVHPAGKLSIEAGIKGIF